MALNTFTIANADNNIWIDFVNTETSQAIVDMAIINRGFIESYLILALADKARQELPTPTGLTAIKKGTHINGNTTYAYKITAVDRSGETLASQAVTINNLQTILYDKNYSESTSSSY